MQYCFCTVTILLATVGCARSLPPEVIDFKPPTMKVTEESKPELVVANPAPQPVVAPPPQPARPAASAPAAIVAAPPPTPPQPTKATAPTIIGTWRVAEMSRNGQSSPMPAGMSMSITFSDGGNVSISMSGGPGGAGQDQQGTYTLNENQISMTMRGHVESGTLNFESSNRAVLDLGQTRMVLSR